MQGPVLDAGDMTAPHINVTYMFLLLPEELWPWRQHGWDTGHEWLHNALAQKSVHREDLYIPQGE